MTVNDDSIEEIIQEIALKHGIAVGRNDPILILQTINARLMRNSATAQQDILDHFKEELEAIVHRWGEDAKGKAERTLNAALAASQDAMAQTMQDGANMASDAIRQEIETLSDRLTSLVHDGRRIAVMNIVAGGMVIFAATLALWASL